MFLLHGIANTPIPIILWDAKKINEPIGIISNLSGTIMVPLKKERENVSF